jgi:hypothetical protein
MEKETIVIIVIVFLCISLFCGSTSESSGTSESGTPVDCVGSWRT